MSAAPPPDPDGIAQAAGELARGRLVAFPTETVYGLGADADLPAAVAAIFAAKGRPADHPLIVHLADAGALDAWARDVSPAARALARAFWPGPLTLVLPRSSRAHDGLTGGQDTIGLRCPDHPVALALLRALGALRADPAAGIAAPSANRYGRISPTRAAHVRDEFGQGPGSPVARILDGGPCARGIESTIVQCLPGALRLLRPGSISPESIEAVAGLPVQRPGSDADGPRAPGRIAGHYAPRHPLEIVARESLADRLAGLPDGPLAVLAPAGLALPRRAGLVVHPGHYEDAAAFAHDLYELLRAMDASGAGRILVVDPPVGPGWDAVHDRLERSCAGSGAQG